MLVTQLAVVTQRPAAADAQGPQAGRQQAQIRELIDLIEAVSLSGRPELTKEIMALPSDDPRKKVVLTGLIVHDLVGNIPARYAGLFQQLGLDASAIQTMTKLMVVERLLAREALDYLTPTRVEVKVDIEEPALGGAYLIGATGNMADLSDVPQRRAEAIAPATAEISNLLGSEKYALYENYMKAEPTVQFVQTFQQRLQHIGVPSLSESQTTQLLAAVLADQTPLSGIYRMNQLTDTAVQAAQSFLNPTQLQVLERVHWENQRLDEAILTAVQAKRLETAAAGK